MITDHVAIDSKIQIHSVLESIDLDEKSYQTTQGCRNNPGLKVNA